MRRYFCLELTEIDYRAPFLRARTSDARVRYVARWIQSVVNVSDDDEDMSAGVN